MCGFNNFGASVADSYFSVGSTLCSPATTAAFMDLDVSYRAPKRSRVSAVPFLFRSCPMDALPEECLFEILRRLPGSKERSISSCVSKRWLLLLSSIRRSESAAPAAESEEEGEEEGHLSRSLKGQEATDIRLAAVAVGTAGHGGLGELLIRGSNKTRGVTDLGLSAIARGCPSLRSLSLWDVPCIGDAGLTEIANGCPLLEKLNIYKCPLISDKGIAAIARACPNLKSVTLDCCSQIGNEGLRAIGRGCPNLQVVSIRRCPLVGDQGVVGLVVSASSSLEKITLHGLSVTDVSLAVLGHYGSAVTDVVLSGLQCVTEKGFWVMGNALGMGKLGSLSIVSCRGVTDLGLQAIAKGSPLLKQLRLRNCLCLSDAGLKSSAEALAALETLELEDCDQITLLGILAVLYYQGSKLKSLCLSKCSGIRDLDYCPTPLPRCTALSSIAIRNCPGFSSSSLYAVGQICPMLQRIDLSGLVGVTDAGLVPLIESSESGLVKVVLSGCANLTDDSVSALVRKHGSTLQVLHLDGCKKITDKSLLSVSESCFQLVDLDVSSCMVTDNGVATLASAGQLNLQVLSISGCSTVTPRSLPFLGKIGQSLLGLNLKQCCNLIGTTYGGIGSLEEKLWWCDILS